MTIYPPSRRALGAAVLGAALLAGCGSAPRDQFYTLGGAPATPAAAPAPAAGATLYFEMRPVTIPAEVRRPQLVVGGREGRVELLEHHRWAGPLVDQITGALSLALANELGAVDVYRNPAPEGSAVYRIGANVQRFESKEGGYALLDATWSVRRLDGDVQTCRSVLREPVGAGYDALVAGHRAALAKLAAAIAANVRSQAAGSGAGCAS